MTQINHKELLARIDEDAKFLEQYFGGKFKGQSALRAVVELCKPSDWDNDYNIYWKKELLETIERNLR